MGVGWLVAYFALFPLNPTPNHTFYYLFLNSLIIIVLNNPKIYIFLSISSCSTANWVSPVLSSTRLFASIIYFRALPLPKQLNRVIVDRFDHIICFPGIASPGFAEWRTFLLRGHLQGIIILLIPIVDFVFFLSCLVFDFT